MVPCQHLTPHVALFIRLRRPSSVCCKTSTRQTFVFICTSSCLCRERSSFIGFILYVAILCRHLCQYVTKHPQNFIEGQVFTFYCSPTTLEWAKWASSSEKDAYFLVLFHNSDTMCRCVCYLVSINGFCSLKLSSWREVPLLLSCSYKPSGLGSHGDADALQALFAHQIRVFCCYNRILNLFYARLSYVQTISLTNLVYIS